MFNKLEKCGRGYFLGCVADDFTGASDMASFLVDGGIETLLINGIPEDNLIVPNEVQAIVIALKIRTTDIEKAIDESQKAFKLLHKWGCNQLFYKYCSTFDSYKEGNIGPVIDKVLEEFDIEYTIISPALPINGRTVKDGELFVHGIPLHESSMKNHPITPMWDSKITNLMSNQGKYETYNINHKIIEQGKEMVLEEIRHISNSKNTKHFYIVVDHFNDKHAEEIARTFGDIKFLTGSSGLAMELANYHNKFGNRKFKKDNNTNITGKGIVFSGSCSEMTQKQVDFYIKNQGIALKISPKGLYEKSQTIEQLKEFINTNKDHDLLIYSTPDTSKEKFDINLDQNIISELLESTMAELAKYSLEIGYSNIVVAGGETSGAITSKLGYKSFFIGRSISPGVPILYPVENNNLGLVLKSGNFGTPDFFQLALKLLKGE